MEPKPIRMKYRFLALAGVAIATILIAFAIVKLTTNPTSPLPSSVLKQINFAVYYPQNLPNGYVYDKNSAVFENSILFFTVSNGSKKISFSEQAAPNNPPDLSAIQKANTSFKDVNTPAGRAILGIDLSSKMPTAILLTNTTLVSISGTKNLPTDVIIKLIQSIGSLPQ